MISFFLVWLSAFFKRLFHKKSFLLLLLVFPLLCLIINAGTQTEKPLLQAALFFEENSPLAEETTHLLIQKNDVVHFYIVPSKTRLEQDVATSKAECGFIFTKDYTYENILEPTLWKNSVQTVHSPGSMLADSVSELVFESFFQSYCRELLISYLENNDVLKKPSQLSDVLLDAQTLYAEHCEDGSTFSFDFARLSEDSLEKVTLETARLRKTFLAGVCRGILSVLLLLGSLIGGLNLFGDRKNSLFLPIRSNRRIIIEKLDVAAPVLCMAASGIVGMACFGILNNPLWELLGLILYVLSLIFGIYLLLRIVKSEAFFRGLMPLFTLGSLVFAPVILDLSTYVKALRIPKYFFLNSLYLDMINGGAKELFLLLGVTLVLGVCSLAAARFSRS